MQSGVLPKDFKFPNIGKVHRGYLMPNFSSDLWQALWLAKYIMPEAKISSLRLIQKRLRGCASRSGSGYARGDKRYRMTPAAFLRTVLTLWGDHWQQPCQALLAKHGHRYSRQQLWNWKTGNRRVPEHVELILERAQEAATR
jgi:hypothetical protein